MIVNNTFKQKKTKNLFDLYLEWNIIQKYQRMRNDSEKAVDNLYIRAKKKNILTLKS